MRSATPLVVARRVLLSLATAAAALYLGRVTLTYGGTVLDRIALVCALKVFLVLAIALYWAWTREVPSTRLTALCERRAPLLVAGLVVATDLLVLLSTPQIDFGGGELGTGYGDDGVWYGWMAEHFAWFEHPIDGKFAYRWLPAMLVHYSGLDTFTGFKLLNLTSSAVAVLLAYRVALCFSPSRTVAVVACALFATLKFGTKFLLYYPVLTDGAGLALLMLVVWATLEKRPGSYTAAMVAAAICRENLLALTPFSALHVVRTGRGRGRFARAALLQVVPWGAFLLSRRFPVFLPSGDEGIWATVAEWWTSFLLDPRRQQQCFLAYVNSLGVLALVPLLCWRSTIRLLAERYEWAAFVAVSVVLAIGGGSDVDRFAVWFAPFALVALVAARDWSGPLPRRWVHLVLVQAAAMELFLPWFPDKIFYLSRYAVHAGPITVYIAVFSWTLLAIVVAMLVDDPAVRPAAEL